MWRLRRFCCCRVDWTLRARDRVCVCAWNRWAGDLIVLPVLPLLAYQNDAYDPGQGPAAEVPQHSMSANME